MPRYKIITLVDITKSNPSRTELSHLKRSQQDNFNSLIQTIGLRANLSWNIDPMMKEGRLPLPFEGKGAYWEWEFEVETRDVFLKDIDSIGLLLEDIHGVPIVDGLNNTVSFDIPIFNTKEDKRNIFISEINIS